MDVNSWFSEILVAFCLKTANPDQNCLKFDIPSKTPSFREVIGDKSSMMKTIDSMKAKLFKSRIFAQFFDAFVSDS